jgi:hypothetical protein
VTAAWHAIDAALRPQAAVEALVAPFLGGDDPLFGTRFSGSLADFFDADRLAHLQPDLDAVLNIVYGCGAALAGWDGLLVYVDVPKNEIQYRSRAGSVTNLGMGRPLSSKEMYKRFYFVDWVALNRHKARLLPHIDLIVDEQRPDEPAFMAGNVLREGLARMSRTCFRVRPWFEPGPWGGQWLRRRIPQLAQDVPNYAWSFELIAPENGLMFRSSERLLEVSFDLLMFQAYREVLGDFAPRFGYEFPIRFAYDDTIDGGNLSVQCHPRQSYVRSRFGENFTQDETYYILDCKPGSRVYLGFRAGIDPGAFRAALERSYREVVPLDVDAFVNSVPAHRHDLFLIPGGTIHSSGANNLVLEISATPYIFTLKMYDWMRMDLDGTPRPLNIERAFQNLVFERQGERVQAELVSHPLVLEQHSGWRRVHLPTHPEHFYDIQRVEFETHVELATDGSPHLMNLVEGEWIEVETPGGHRQRLSYAETLAVPAAAGRYVLINRGKRPARVLIAFLKAEWFEDRAHDWLQAPPDMLPDPY